MVSWGNHRPNLDRRPFRALWQSLREAFDTDFDLWCQSSGWYRIPEDPAAPLVEATAEEAAWLEAAWQPDPQATCVDHGEGLATLVLPLGRYLRRPLVASRQFCGQSPALLTRLGRLYLRERAERAELERLRGEHQGYLRQITQAMEELAFLRSMSRLLEVSDLSFDFLALAHTMLPILKPMLDVESLLLVVASERGDMVDLEQERVVEPGGGLWAGTSAGLIRMLVRRYRDAAAVQPVVKNRFADGTEAAEFPGIRNFVLVPVVNSDVTIGWLLALNREGASDHRPGDRTPPDFAAHELTLLTSSAAILATHARNVDLFRRGEGLLVSVVRALVSAVEAKDEYTRGHSERVALYSRRLAEELGQDEAFCERIYLTGLLHDVGKIGVSDRVLGKTGPLTPTEFEEIKRHPEQGWQILHDLHPLRYVLPGVLHHHEQFDGFGYPDQLVGCEIPFDVRILAVADAYDAMTSDRPYRPGMPQDEAERILREGAGRQWDPVIVTALFRCMPAILQIKHEYRPRLAEVRRTSEVAAVATGY